MRVCIVSDSHDNRSLLKTAVTEAKALGAEVVLHCGDVVAPTCLVALQPLGLPVHVIHGNNQGDTVAMCMLAQKPDSRVYYYGMDAGLELGERRIFLVHYPHYAEALALTGDWDLVCCGHDHQPVVRSVANCKGGTTWLVNPGTVGGIGPRASYILADLDSLEFEVRDVPGSRSSARGRAASAPRLSSGVAETGR